MTWSDEPVTDLHLPDGSCCDEGPDPEDTVYQAWKERHL